MAEDMILHYGLNQVRISVSLGDVFILLPKEVYCGYNLFSGQWRENKFCIRGLGVVRVWGWGEGGGAAHVLSLACFPNCFVFAFDFCKISPTIAAG